MGFKERGRTIEMLDQYQASGIHFPMLKQMVLSVNLFPETFILNITNGLKIISSLFLQDPTTLFHAKTTIKTLHAFNNRIYERQDSWSVCLTLNGQLCYFKRSA